MIELHINDQEFMVTVQPGDTLLMVLREQLGFFGARCGCDQGACGACSVLLDGEVVSSCMVLALDARNRKIVTIEGIGSPDNLHPLQAAFVEYGAIQCGFCTPGMILAAKALLDKNPNPTELEVRKAIAGNLCRCTGYAKILTAIKSAAKEMDQGVKCSAV